jgi:hypothetical protein
MPVTSQSPDHSIYFCSKLSASHRGTSLGPFVCGAKKNSLISIPGYHWYNTFHPGWHTERCEQPRVARPAGVAPSDARSIEQLRVTVSSQEQPRAARLFCATASGKKPH